METPIFPGSSETTDTVTIQKGTILVYRVFDIAEEIDLKIAERVLTEASGKERLKLSRSTKHAVIIKNAPVMLSLGETSLELGKEIIRAETYAKIWDYGVLSIAFQLPIVPGTTWTQLLARSAAIEASDDIDRAARKRASDLATTLSAALQSPGEWEGYEDYVIFFFEALGGVKNASELMAKADIPALLLAETDTGLAKDNRDAILEYLYQYRDTDLIVIDWNSAVVVEPSGQRDIVDVVEFALTHLLEMRYYDDLLDLRLNTLYDSIEQRRRNLARTAFWKISHEASSRYIEFSEFIERVDNSLKVVGDFYLARIFRGAARRFRINDWQQSISRKMGLLAQVSELLQGEVNTQRSMLLEIIIIVLITFEILYALLKVRA